MRLFLSHLVRALHGLTPGFLENSVFLLDGAKYHLSEETKTAFRKLGADLIFSGPYSYSAAPCELLFAALKRVNLLTSPQNTEKSCVITSFHPILTCFIFFRNFTEIVDMVRDRLSQVP